MGILLSDWQLSAYTIVYLCLDSNFSTALYKSFTYLLTYLLKCAIIFITVERIVV